MESFLAHTTPFPLDIEVDRAEGLYIYAKDGSRYMDMVSGIGVSALGHGHPEIVSAIRDQAERHMHVMVYGEFKQEAQDLAGKRLVSLLPDELNCVYFVNSGTEANEAALKLAKRATGRSKIIAFQGAYHGSTHGSLSVSGNEMKKYAFRPLLPDVYHIPFNDIDGLSIIDGSTAAVIMETIQGDAGVRIPSKEFMQALRQKCDESGAMLILDEIQCGLGRTGKNFAFEHFSIVPDILTLGKALGGGMPIGAMVSSEEKMNTLTYDPPLGHITTFGGHPVVCAATAAFLDVFNKEVDLNEVDRKGNRIREKLSGHPSVKEIRQVGLFFAIDMGDAEVVQKVVEACMSNGLISFWFLSCPSAFRIAPPLNISDEEVEVACSIILNAFNAAG